MSVWNTPRGQLTRIGPWQLGDTLGRGAYAHVRRATNTITGREVACKILPALYASPGPKDWNDILDSVEAHKEVIILKAASGANIPGVVGLEGVLVEEGWTYVFLTLHQSALGGPYDPRGRKLIRFFRKLLRVVQALHDLSISHEDLKRSNILLSFDDDDIGPALADFGFSQFFPFGGEVRSLGGTFDYSSPEKVADGKYDPCANDVWSLGILLIKMLNIRHPYVSKADDPKAARTRILNHPPIWDWTDRDLRSGRADLIMGMLDRNPETRFSALAHPFLHDAGDQLDPIKVPALRLSSKVPRPVNSDVIQDIAFMSYINKTHFLCQTPKLIQQRLASREHCWEKRWATMLTGWERSRDLQWEDLPSFPHMPVKNPPMPRLPKTIKPLKPIYLSPITGMPMPNKLATPDKVHAKSHTEMGSSLAPPPAHGSHYSPPQMSPADDTSPDAEPVNSHVPARKTRVKAMKTKSESMASSPINPRRVLALSKTQYAAVGGEVKAIRGRGGFGNNRFKAVIGAEELHASEAVTSSGSSTAVSHCQTDTYHKNREPLGGKKTVAKVPVQTRRQVQKTQQFKHPKERMPEGSMPAPEITLQVEGLSLNDSD